ncbi:MAG TPA: phosphoribosylglycinamide synthetase C domain-containing protein [Acidimicrobiales bacterium]
MALAPAQDFKRVENGDRGPNTGGMGAYSPVPVAGKDVVDEVMDAFVGPTLRELRRRGIDYRGVLYAGLMLTPEGPKLIEYNVRFGDPEAQVVLPRMEGDLARLLAGAASGSLAAVAGEARFGADAAVTVVCCAGGYPGGPLRTGVPISGLDAAAAVPGVTLFHAGTALSGSGPLVVAGGRVLGVTALAPTIAGARARAYAAAGHLSWEGIHYRGDIAEAAAGEAA